MDKQKSTELSVIIPVKNEEDNVSRLGMEVSTALEGFELSWECLWIDDGSTDKTLDEMKKLHEKEPNHRYIVLDRNYGQSAGLSAGFDNAKGHIFATLDGDGQNDPADIPALVRLLVSENADMVNGVRQKRRDSIIRKISSKIANAFRNWVTGEMVKDVGCAIRAFRSECIRKIPVFKGMHRFIPTLIALAGYSKILEIPVNHRPREFGKTKYGINNRLWVGLWDSFAVMWMQNRVVRYQLADKQPTDTESS